MKKMTLFMVLITLSIFSCGKDEALTKTEMLTQNEWNLVAAKLTANGVEVPGSSALDDCDLDDIYKFKAEGTYVQEIGSILCYEEDEPWIGTWTFLNSETEFMLDGDEEDILKIETLTDKVFVLSFESVDPSDNITYKFQTTYNAK